MPVLDVQNAKKAFGDNEVLHDISFHVDQGEVVAIIGPSGSGNPHFFAAAPHWKRWTAGAFTLGRTPLSRQPRQAAAPTPTGRHSSESAGALAWSSRISISFPIFL